MKLSKNLLPIIILAIFLFGFVCGWVATHDMSMINSHKWAKSEIKRVCDEKSPLSKYNESTGEIQWQNLSMI